MLFRSGHALASACHQGLIREFKLPTQGEAKRFSKALAAWNAASNFNDERFCDRFTHGLVDDLATVRRLRQAAAGSVTAQTFGQMVDASRPLTAAIKDIGAHRWTRVREELEQRAEKAGNLALGWQQAQEFFLEEPPAMLDEPPLRPPSPKIPRAQQNYPPLDRPSLPDPPIDPTKPPGPDWIWQGRPGSKPGGPQGSWWNPKTGESLHPDFDHPGDAIKPHWDWMPPPRSPNADKGYRWYRDGTLEPKKSIDIDPTAPYNSDIEA